VEAKVDKKRFALKRGVKKEYSEVAKFTGNNKLKTVCKYLTITPGKVNKVSINTRGER